MSTEQAVEMVIDYWEGLTDMEPLALPRLAAKAHEIGLVVAAMVHGYNRWPWAHAIFDLPDGRYEGMIDALAVKYGSVASATRKALMTLRVLRAGPSERRHRGRLGAARRHFNVAVEKFLL